jgi:Flp pilus assembly protein TadG
MKAMIGISMLPFRGRLPRFFRDRRGVAAIEFAMIAPFMLIAFFGTVEFCTAVAIDRKVTLIARTFSDLTSQQTPPSLAVDGASIADPDFVNNFTAGMKIVQPYDATLVLGTISEVYVDSNAKATVQWSRSAIVQSGATQATLTTSARKFGDDVSNVVPPQLLVKQTYLIFSETSYKYTPTIGYVMAKAGVNMSDVSYTRPRQATCITYNNVPLLVAGKCPQS